MAWFLCLTTLFTEIIRVKNYRRFFCIRIKVIHKIEWEIATIGFPFALEYSTGRTVLFCRLHPSAS